MRLGIDGARAVRSLGVYKAQSRVGPQEQLILYERVGNLFICGLATGVGICWECCPCSKGGGCGQVQKSENDPQSII